MDTENNAILRIGDSRLRHEEHFQCKTEIKVVIDRFDGVKEKLGAIYIRFSNLLEEEDRMLEVIHKSEVTARIAACDQRRDETTSGLFRHIDADCLHFDPARRQSANSLQIIRKHYMGITRQNVESQTASTNKMLQEFETKRDLLNQLHLGEWVDHLRECNERTAKLIALRDSESATRPVSQMKLIRPEIDQCTTRIFNALETFTETFPEEQGFVETIKLINEINRRFDNTLARRQGTSEAAKARKAEAEK
jgi:hypothetical protein